MRSETSCTTPQDHSSYWFPAMHNGRKLVKSTGPQIVYYKSGVKDYNSVRAFPPGLRMLIGSPTATQTQFRRDSRVSGWTCGNTGDHYDFPRRARPHRSCWCATKPRAAGTAGTSTAPTASRTWPTARGRLLPEAPDRRPRARVQDRPSAATYPKLRLSSGRGYSWHADFFAAWDMPYSRR